MSKGPGEQMRTEVKCGSNVYAKKRNFCSNGLSALRNTMGWEGAGRGLGGGGSGAWESVWPRC